MQHQAICQPVEVLEGHKYLPCISIIMPFETQITPKQEVFSKLNNVVKKIKAELMTTLADDKWVPAITRLEEIIKGLNYCTFKKSIAIFLSPLIEKVYYLDLEVQETFSTDDSFNIRDLIYSKKNAISYFLVVIDSSWTKIYHITATASRLVISIGSKNWNWVKIDGNHQDAPAHNKENEEDENIPDHLQNTDASLGLLLQAQSLPVFVLGNNYAINAFKKISVNKQHVIKYFTDIRLKNTGEDILQLMRPVAENWKAIKQHALKQKIQIASMQGNLVTGITDVLQAVSRKRKRLLIMEKQFTTLFRSFTNHTSLLSPDAMLNSAFYINDVADLVIEKVLESGGDVDFLETGDLADYQGVVLIN